MDTQFISKKELFKFSVFSFIVVLALLIKQTAENSAKVVFCDVGQGDAVYIKTKEGMDILIDAGTSGQVLNCLGKYMPFWDRTLELAFLSHSQADHYGGFAEVGKRYKIKRFFVSGAGSSGKSYRELLDILRKSETRIIFVYQGDRIKIGKKSRIEFLWPSRQYIAQRLKYCTEKLDINNQVLGLMETKENDNDFSQIFLFSSESTDILFTGDTTHQVQAQLLSLMQRLKQSAVDGKIEILKVPHHGAKNGLLSDFLTVVGPQTAVISVSKKNNFGHPSQQIINILQESQVEVRKTADEGDVVFFLK